MCVPLEGIYKWIWIPLSRKGTSSSKWCWEAMLVSKNGTWFVLRLWVHQASSVFFSGVSSTSMSWLSSQKTSQTNCFTEINQCCWGTFFGLMQYLCSASVCFWSFTFTNIFSFNNFFQTKTGLIPESFPPLIHHIMVLTPSPCSLRCIAVAEPLPSLSGRYQALEYTGNAGHFPKKSIHPYRFL